MECLVHKGLTLILTEHAQKLAILSMAFKNIKQVHVHVCMSLNQFSFEAKNIVYIAVVMWSDYLTLWPDRVTIMWLDFYTYSLQSTTIRGMLTKRGWVRCVWMTWPQRDCCSSEWSLMTEGGTDSLSRWENYDFRTSNVDDPVPYCDVNSLDDPLPILFVVTPYQK